MVTQIGLTYQCGINVLPLQEFGVDALSVAVLLPQLVNISDV